ncbi:HNH endonuclease signature motif containing protein [Streptomyces diastaticus]
MSRTCIECSAPISREGYRCRSCAARHRWATNREPERPYRTHEGIRYYLQSDGYYRASRHRGGELQHRAVWRTERGPIPEGWHIHHKDGDPGNNDIANLEALTPLQHLSVEHGDRGPMPDSTRARLSAAKRAWWLGRQSSERVCDECGDAFKTRATRVRFCGPSCNTRYWNRQKRAGAGGAGLGSDG